MIRSRSARSVRAPINVLLAFIIGVSVATADEPRERVSFDLGWRFTRGDHDNVGDSLDYERIRDWILPTGEHLVAPRSRAARTPEPWVEASRNYSGTGLQTGMRIVYNAPDFDDSGWRQLDLPHDWGIEGPFQQQLAGDTGKLPWAGVGWYRKRFHLPASDNGRRIHLELDGAMSFALVWCNGRLVGGWPYGYTSWRVDLTPHVKTGAENVIAIRLDNPRISSRWYPGSGLYRHTWLLKTSPVAIAQWGVTVTAPQVTADRALVHVAVQTDNRSPADVEAQIAVELFAADVTGRPAGPVLARGDSRPARIESGREAHAAVTMAIDRPKLWSLAARHRHVAVTTVTQGGRLLDRVETPFGIRTVEHTADRGLLLNGERVPLRGVCLHHDLGALGAAVNTRALERQLEILREMGCNALRTAHNPPAPELLELCDRMGFLVMVEAFDCWRLGKRRDGYNRVFDDWHEQDLRAMVRRDRNHPSVIQWSIGNEVLEQGEPDGWKLAAHLAAIVREEDHTRPVTAGLSRIEAPYKGFESALDVVGYNYKPHEYAGLHRTHPHLILLGAETASTVSSRGEYFFPVEQDKSRGQTDFQVSSYDLYAPPWATTPDDEWRGLDGTPPVLGEFVWTGFDYLGEPTPYNSDATNLLNYSDPAEREKAARELAALGRIAVPSRSSYFGIVDLAGFPKDRYYLYQARWRPDLPMAHILPHWNWPERIGQVTPVHVYTSGDEAELFLNGRSLGRKRRGPGEYRFRWDDAVYQPGELGVVTYRAGRPWAESIRRTTGAPERLLATPDRATLHADGADLAFVTVTVADRDGQLVPRSKHPLIFKVTGPADLITTDNGDPTDHAAFQSKERKAFNGLALAIIRPHRNKAGPITLRVESPGLTSAELTLQSRLPVP